MKRLLKQASAFKYVITSTVRIEELGQSEEVDSYYGNGIDSDIASKLVEAVDSDMKELGPKGLAEHLDDSYSDAVESIIVTFDGGVAKTNVNCNRELTTEEQEAVKEYVSGQFSDGWGEGFEQRPIYEYTDYVEYEDYDEEEQEPYTTTVKEKIGIYVSFWNYEQWSIDIQQA